MRIQRVQDIPHGELAIVVRKPGHASSVQLNGRLVTEAQALQLGSRLKADPDFLRMLLGEGDV